jgi:hypothetical protein
MFYFKGCFKAMEDVGILDMDNPFLKKKIHYDIYFNFPTCYGWVCCGLEAKWDYEDSRMWTFSKQPCTS